MKGQYKSEEVIHENGQGMVQTGGQYLKSSTRFTSELPNKQT